MTLLRVGTRGSALALRQTRWVIGELHKRRPELEFQEVIIKTHGDVAHDQPIDSSNWPVGGFVGAIEQALLASEIDFAVHSYKDLPSVGPEELVIVAVPPRAAVHDVLLTRQAIDFEQLPNGFRIGTSSPRRRAQFLRFAGVETVPIRGNVPTRVKKMETGQVDGVVLAAAGLERLGLTAPHMMNLATDRTRLHLVEMTRQRMRWFDDTRLMRISQFTSGCMVCLLTVPPICQRFSQHSRHLSQRLARVHVAVPLAACAAWVGAEVSLVKGIG